MFKIIFTVILQLIVFVIFAAAQFNPEKAVVDTINQINDIKTRSIELERIKRDAEKRPVSENKTVKFPEIKEDFEQIQRIDLIILQTPTANNSVYFSNIIKQVSEINRRAIRLKSNLFPEESKNRKDSKNDSQQHRQINSQDLKNLLKSLDLHVFNFVNNPIFQNLSVVDLKDTRNAQKELDFIVEISAEIKDGFKNSPANSGKN